MKISVGTNIKRLRSEKGITQEQLAAAMNVTCAAVSKWERGETYPDITMLQPLAFYFGVTLDELMGYDKEKVSEQIELTIAEYKREDRENREKAQKIIDEAYREYPNDYRIMHLYMWSRGIYDAEPDLDLALEKKDELSKICDKIIEGCTDGQLRLSAWKMKAILLHAEGRTDEALAIHRDKCGNWYNTSGQMNEQLFQKDRPEFLYWARRNMYELAAFAADKLVKAYFFDHTLPYEAMLSRLEQTGDVLFRLGTGQNEAYLTAQAYALFERLQNDLKCRKFRGAKDEDITRIADKYLEAAAKLSELATDDAPLFDALVNSRGTDDLLAFAVNNARVQ
ncbi:MAG: helix-turn-helix transcriptional regulator [Clostridia bacterium]|nr:helix-turn-helix transcriptional regulator [Clostridia bacterium]